MYRAAVIGLGFIGYASPDSHLKAYQDCPDTELVGVCDKYFVSTLFSDPQEMILATRPDIVSICTPTETHRDIVLDVAPLVKAIYLEKPIATSLKEADEIIKVCHKYDVILQVNHQREFSTPVMRWSRGIVNNGTHAFSLIRQMGAIGKVKMEYVDTEDYIFELDIHANPAPSRLVLKGVEHLVDCLDNHHESLSSGEDAREVLRLVLEYKEEWDAEHRSESNYS